MKRFLVLPAVLCSSLVAGHAFANRWFTREAKPYDARPSRPTPVREAPPHTARILERESERARPTEDAVGSAAAKSLPAKESSESGVLGRQANEKARGVVDHAMAKVSKGHATTRDSDGGNDTRQLRESEAKLRSLSQSSGAMNKKALEIARGVLDRAMSKASGGHATSRDSEGGNDGRKLNESAGKLRSLAHSKGKLNQHQLEMARGIVDKAMSKMSRGHATTRDSDGGNDGRKLLESQGKLKALAGNAGVLNKRAVRDAQKEILRKIERVENR
jgi:ribosomal protein L16/L10AE